MKVILSRKGFDSANGGIPSPIMPDGTMLSMPIPLTEENAAYSDIQWNGISYLELLNQLAPERAFDKCHLDPDIRDNRIKHVPNWVPAFGQLGSAQGKLRNAGVEVGDLILFFGWFRKAIKNESGYHFAPRKGNDFYAGNDLQAVFGYMQIGKIITDKDQIKKYYWHPHSTDIHTRDKNNVLYLPSDKLSFLPSLKGYGTLDYRQDRVLTKKDCTRATWNEYPFFMPEHIKANVKNSAKGEGLYYSGIWQEMVVEESPGLMKWVKEIVM